VFVNCSDFKALGPVSAKLFVVHALMKLKGILERYVMLMLLTVVMKVKAKSSHCFPEAPILTSVCQFIITRCPTTAVVALLDPRPSVQVKRRQ
jgi:hypothetical protein